MLTVGEIRSKLVSLGLSQEEANNIKGKTTLMEKLSEMELKEASGLLEENSKNPIIDFSAVEPEIESDTNVDTNVSYDDPPLPNSPEGHDYVMTKFVEDELNQGKYPTVDGLRRVAELLLGEIVESTVHTLQVPNKENYCRATVQHTVIFETYEGKRKVFSDVSDVFRYNTPAEFANHATATASSKAEGRALRKALRLRKIISAEEAMKSEVDASEVQSLLQDWDSDAIASDSQIIALDRICSRANIDVLKYINSGAQEYDSEKEVPFAVMRQMISNAHKYLEENDNHEKVNPVPNRFEGYKSDWRQNYEEV